MRWAAAMGVFVALVGCTHERALRKRAAHLGAALKHRDSEQVGRYVVAGQHRRLDHTAIRKDTAGLSRRVAAPDDVVVQAAVLTRDGHVLRAEEREGRWLLTEDPTAPPGSATPRAALRSFVAAAAAGDWAALRALAPRRLRIGMTEEDLAAVWTQEPSAKELGARRDELVRHLHTPIVKHDDEARLTLPSGRSVLLEREGDGWVVTEF